MFLSNRLFETPPVDQRPPQAERKESFEINSHTAQR